MSTLLVSCLTACTLFLLGWGMLRPERIYEFPFLTGVITFSFILPQVPGLATESFLPAGAFARTAVFMMLCLFMCWWGWSGKAKPFSFFRIDFDEGRLLIVAAVLSVAGAYFYFKLSRLPGELTIAVQMTGVPVIYIFFSRLLSYGMAIAALCIVRRFSWWTLIILAFDLVFYLDRIVVTGKRAEAIELIMIFALAWWFYRRRAIPRTLIITAIFLGTLSMNSMGDYRAITKANSAPVWDDISRIDVVGNLSKVLRDGGDEMRNAILRINNTATTLQFDYGKFHWNRLVFNFVPAQLVGANVKQSFMLPVPTMARDYDPIVGTTETGMADAFQSFWYLGAFKFFILAYLVRRIWVTANQGEFSAQFTYVLSIIPSMHAISHQTDWVLMIWVHMLMFAAPALFFAAIPARSGVRHRSGPISLAAGG
ncbi:hypothetical protein [Neorhizobium alkalisoli]|jgi:hypothetical protein|uniref:Oligosaccharide repeat unit polymerase n=1 Tax=Neorhizobium alkalisoli TaxID=528178 RepID=A0A561QCI9_9HYPH|nr:hypothetical protein [Neorhizobium alkalisoli]TWF48078.1 hypothetical protein FHW37_109141 [Neorhizobium alkalisoli]